MKTKRKQRILRGAAAVLAVLGVLWLVINQWPRTANYPLTNPMRVEGRLPMLIAHGGGNREFPDNTLEAFYNAFSVDPHCMMETDVSITKDGVVILSHDTTLDRKTNVTGAIADWSYADLMAQKVDFGYTNPTQDGQLSGPRTHFADDSGVEKYPTDVSYPDGVTPRDEKVFLATTLEELLVCFPQNPINVEIKQPGALGMQALGEVLRLLEVYDAWDRVVLASFHEEIYAEFQRLQAEEAVPLAFMCSPAEDAFTEFYVLQLLGLDALFRDRVCVFQLPTEQYHLNLASRRLIRAAHRNNIAVHYWTINDPEEMRRLIAADADGIMTDYPHRLGQVYDTYQ